MQKHVRNWGKLLKKAIFATLMCSLALSQDVSAQLTTVTIGTNSGTNGTQTYPSPLQDYYYATRAQYLYLESELQAAGILPGATISSIGWEATATTNTTNSNPILMEN
jgi:hypothetical protein